MTATRIACEVFAEIDGDTVRIMAQPDGHAPVCLFSYPGPLADKAKLTAARMEQRGDLSGPAYIGLVSVFEGEGR